MHADQYRALTSRERAPTVPPRAIVNSKISVVLAAAKGFATDASRDEFKKCRIKPIICPSNLSHLIGWLLDIEGNIIERLKPKIGALSKIFVDRSSASDKRE